MGRFRTEKCARGQILTKSQDPQHHWRTGTPPGVANQGPVFKPRGKNPRGIMCLSDCVPVGVQAPSLAVHQRLHLSSSFCGSGSSNVGLPDHGNSRYFIVDCSGYSACLKIHDPRRRFGWSAAGRVTTSAFEMAALVSVIESASSFYGVNES